MGDLIGEVVPGQLYFVPKSELDRVRRLNGDAGRLSLFANLCRINTLFMIARAGSGHIGSSFSSLDIVTWLYLREMAEQDVYFSSKGHDAPGLYAMLMGIGVLPMDKLHKLRRKDGLPGHPDVSVPGMVINSGSLGMGISKAKGMVRADRLVGRQRRYFVLTGDGELQEGQIWESLLSAANESMGEITVIVDHNKFQSDFKVELTSDLGDLSAKFASFDWQVARVDGHDYAALTKAMSNLSKDAKRPRVIIADTVKGRGVSFMEHTAMESDVAMYRFHSGAPNASDYGRALQELLNHCNEGFDALGAPRLELEVIEQPAGLPPAPGTQKLIPAYGAALLEQAKRNTKLIAMDGDLVLDTGLLPFKDALPERYVECGIAEQDMVSQAGGLALAGFLPVVHSFACFLSTRPNEQIYNNATERSKVIYVGSLAGVVPGGPGHSHQSVRDISALAGVPGLVMAEPCCEAEVGPLLDHCLNGTADSAYFRLVSVPCDIPFALPDGYRPVEGKGCVLREGRDAVVISYGPVTLSEAVRAADRLAQEDGLQVKIVNLPWLNRVDRAWLKDVIGGIKTVFTIDNHFLAGGQGERIAAALAWSGATPRLVSYGIDSIPVCGTNAEVLDAHGLSAATLAASMRRDIRS